MSPRHKVSLSGAEVRAKAGVPLNAASFSFAYPLAGLDDITDYIGINVTDHIGHHITNHEYSVLEYRVVYLYRTLYTVYRYGTCTARLPV